MKEIKMKKPTTAVKRTLPGPPARPPAKVTIRKIPSGVRGLDEILGGGLPEFSFNIIAGTPGCGKTTLTHQIVFANATVKRPALYFTVLGEPALKMLRYQQQYSFFDESKLGGAVRFINLSDVVLKRIWTPFLRRSSGKSRRSIRASWWWILSAPWCARRWPAPAKWRCNPSSSGSPCS